MPSKNFLVDVDVRGSLLIGVIPNNIGSFLTISSNDGKTVSKRSLDEVRQDLALVSDVITNGITAIAPSQNVVFSALLKKANIESPIFTGTVGGITKAMVGLDLIDNTTDASKNVFSATKLTAPVLINGISFNGLTNITVADATKEIAFSKNTAFNKSFGSTIGTVAQGDDYRIDNGQTAYGWGNHAGNYLSLNGGIISGNIVPNLDNTHSLGSPTKMWKDVYIGPGSLYINGKKVIEDVSNTMNITTSIDQNLSVKTSGTGILQISALGSGNIELNAISGLIQLKGSVMFQANKLIRSSDGSALLFDDDIQFSSGTGISGALRVSGATTSLSFIVPNGLSSQFLKANGSVDNNTYSTTSHTHAFSSLTSLPSTLIGYGIVDALPLSGGTITGDIVVGTNDRNRGMFGTYDSTKTQHIWSIGTSFRNSATGVDFGNLFGLAYKHTNNITGGSMAGGHQMVWTANGVPRSAIGEGGIWSAGSLSVASGIFGSNLSFPVTINDSGIIFNNRQQGAVSYPSSKKGFNWEISSDGASMAAYELGGDMLEYEFLISDNKASNDRYVWKLNEWQGIYTGIEAMKLVPGSSLFNSQTLLQYGNILLNAPALATRLLSNINTSLNASHTTYIRNNSSFTNPDLGGSTISLTANVSNFTGVNHTGYVIKIKDAVSTPNTFCWSAGGQQGNNVNTPALWHGNDIPLSTSPITLSNGVTITFNAVTGGIANETIGFAVLPKSDIRAQDGTASSPVYTFINSTSTGLYRPSGSNGVGITVSGTERGRFTTIGLDVTGIITATNGNSTNWNDAFGWGNHVGLYSLLNHTHSFSELTSKPTTLSGYGITDALVSRYTFEPGNSAGIRRWVRLVTLDGVSLSSGASIDFILAGTGDFGSAQRGNTHVIAGQRSAGGVSIKVYSLNTENTEDPVEIHYVIKSDFVFEIWAYLSDYNYTHQLTVLQSYGTVINTDSITTTAPDGAVLVPRIDIRHTTNFTAGTGSTNYAVGNDSRINNGQTAFTSLGNYLPLTGGTLSGPLTVNATSIKIVDTLTLGLVSEVGGQLINYGTNFSQLGNRDATKAGGFFRIDTRVGYESQFFNVKFAPANSSEQTIFSLSTTGNLSTNGSITAPTFIGNGITGAVGSNSTQLSTNQFVTRGITNARSFNNITGGGTLSVSGSNEVKWTARFIIIGNGSGVDFSTSGYFDIIPPPTSTIITGVGRSDVTVTTNGITLGSWESLYYILPIGSNQVTINANFRVVSYNSAGVIPDNWILLCVNNPDIGTFNFLKGIVLKVNESYNTAVRSHMATGTGLNVLSTSPTLSGLLTTQQVLIGSGVFLANSYLRIGASVNAHIQGNVNNTNAGTLASSDFVATANNGTDTTNFINMGINSSGNTDATWTMAGANDAYLFNNGGHLTIGTSTLAKDIKFFTAGTMAANEKARIFGATGNFSLGNTTDGGFKLDVTGTARVSGVVTLITPVVDTNTTQAATTAFVLGQASSLNPLINGAVAIGTSLRYARADHIHPIDTSRQTALNGTGFVKIVGTTISYDNSTYLTGTKVDSFNTRTGVVTLSSLDVTTALTFTPYNATNPSSYTSNIGTVTSIGGTGTVNGLTLSGVVSVSGNLILGGTLSNIDNSALINSDITIGTTIIPLGSTQTTLLGLVSVTSTTFVGALSGNASTATNIVWSGVTSTPTTLSGYGISDAISLIEKGAANGVATLDGSGKLLASQIPAITISDTFVVANQTAMLAVVAETGDVAVRTDQNKSYILKGTNPTVLADWQELLTPTSAVTTVFGRSGAVSAASNDYNADQILETTSRVFQTPTQRANNDATSSIQTQLNSKQATLINPITGTGTANYLPKFTGTSTQGNSQIFDNGTNVGFGTATPMYKVDVNGGVINISNGFSEPSSEAGYRLKFADNGGINNDSGIGLSGSLGSESLWINKGSANGNIRFMFGTLGEKVTFTSTGFSGFGTTTPAETIHVEGGVRIKNAWLQSIDNNSLASGIQVVATVEVGTYRAAFFDYVAISGTNVRAGTIMATWYLTTVEFVDTSTNDIGNTSGLILQAVISGSNVVLQSVTSSGTWSVKTLIRMI
jgi:hypothetical protein